MYLEDLFVRDEYRSELDFIMRVSVWWCLCNNNIPLKHLIVHSTFLVCILQFMRYSNCDMQSLSYCFRNGAWQSTFKRVCKGWFPTGLTLATSKTVTSLIIPQVAAATNCARIYWHVLDSNTEAIKFYERNGGQLVREWLTVTMNRDSLTSFVTEKKMRAL